MDWPYLQEEESAHYQNGHNMDSSKKRESGRTETVTETNNDKRAGAEHLEDMGVRLKISKNRVRWRATVEALYITRGNED